LCHTITGGTRKYRTVHFLRFELSSVSWPKDRRNCISTAVKLPAGVDMPLRFMHAYHRPFAGVGL